jgi:hypothetical protein
MPSSWEEEHLRSTICFFPKHKGECWYNVVQNDRDYVSWLLENKEFDDDDAAALEWGVEHVPDRF